MVEPIVLPVDVPSASYDHASLEASPPLETPMLTVSTAFFSGALLDVVQDLVLVTSDGVHFYVNQDELRRASNNGFNGHLKQPLHADIDRLDLPILSLDDEPSDIVNVMVHAVFGKDFGGQSPAMDSVARGINRMLTYGLPAQQYLTSSSSLFHFLLRCAPLYPCDVYAIAAEQKAEELAVLTSSHLLSFPLDQLSDTLARRIGPIYLRRLFFLHLGRLEALRRLLSSPPFPHSPTPNCPFKSQKRATESWMAAICQVAYDARPGSSIRTSIMRFGDSLSCDACKDGFARRVDEILVGWAKIKTTI